MSYPCPSCIPLKMRWLLKSPLGLWLIKIEFWSHNDFKSHIIFRGTQERHGYDIYDYSFHSQGKFEKSFNATFVSLIPEKFGTVEIKYYRPISLLGGVYKIISRVPTNMLKSILRKIVSSSQNAFIRGRQILDSILVANECLDSWIRYEEPRVLCKLDLERACGHAN
jgi:hypothetical protein